MSKISSQYENLPISPLEPLSRFLTSKSQFRAQQKAVHHSALMPRNGEVSVFRVKGLTWEDVWLLGEREVLVHMPPGKELRGCGILYPSFVFEVGLEIDPNNTPQRHANIIGWPQEKDRQKVLAIDLAHRTELNIREM